MRTPRHAVDGEFELLRFGDFGRLLGFRTLARAAAGGDEADEYADQNHDCGGDEDLAFLFRFHSVPFLLRPNSGRDENTPIAHLVKGIKLQKGSN